MIFGKNTHLVGLDIGSRTVKVGELAETKKGYSLKKFGVIDIDPGLIEEGMVQDVDTLADSISELFKTNGIKEQNEAISIGGYSVIVKKINVQTATEEELHLRWRPGDLRFYRPAQLPADRQRCLEIQPAAVSGFSPGENAHE